MTKASERGVPVRADLWRPDDEVLNSIIGKCIDEAYDRSPGGDGSAVFVSGGLVLATLGVIVAAGTGNPMLSLGIVVALAVAGLCFIAVKAAPADMDRSQTLAIAGGAGNLPAGYLVYPPAWDAGMQEFLAPTSDRHLRVAVRLCREHPGSVSDLLRLVRRAEKQLEGRAQGKAVTESEIFRLTARFIVEQVSHAPTMVLSR